MGQISFSESPLHAHRSAPAAAAETGLIARSFDLLLTWHERRRARANLIGLPDGILKDMGLSRGDAEYEYEKPFWRG